MDALESLRVNPTKPAGRPDARISPFTEKVDREAMAEGTSRSDPGWALTRIRIGGGRGSPENNRLTKKIRRKRQHDPLLINSILFASATDLSPIF